MVCIRFILFCLLFTSAQAVFSNFGLCCLCSGCGRAVDGRGSQVISSSGRTCNTMALKMADKTKFRVGSTKCKRFQDRFRNKCCNSSYRFVPKLTINKTTKNVPQKNYGKGSEPVCHVCHNGKFPRRPNTVTAVLYMPGKYTCKDLYYMGRAGKILDRLCNPLQDYFQQPCGCDPH